jgi:hypothetical protein
MLLIMPLMLGPRLLRTACSAAGQAGAAELSLRLLVAVSTAAVAVLLAPALAAVLAGSVLEALRAAAESPFLLLLLLLC